MYWFTDPYQSSYCCGYNYGQNVTTARAADASDGNMHPHWAFVEVGWPFDVGGRTIAPPEIRSATWHSLIAGARGIIYFQHSFGGSCITHHVLRDTSGCYSAVQDQVRTLDAQIKQLAPVLNAPIVTGGFGFSGPIRASAHLLGNDLYIFAGSTTGATSASFTVPSGTQAEVQYEGRSIPVSAGSFTDTFADKNAIHIYKVAL
jgi:hypothetical protein